MTYVQRANLLNSKNCTAFHVGCPNMFYLSDEIYKCKFKCTTFSYSKYVLVFTDTYCMLDETERKWRILFIISVFQIKSPSMFEY